MTRSASARQRRKSRGVPARCEAMRRRARASDARCRNRQRLLSSKKTALLENPLQRISAKRPAGRGGGGGSRNPSVELTTPPSASAEPSTEAGGPIVGVGEGSGAEHAD